MNSADGWESVEKLKYQEVKPIVGVPFQDDMAQTFIIVFLGRGGGKHSYFCFEMRSYYTDQKTDLELIISRRNPPASAF